MKDSPARAFIITGTSGTGKTELLDHMRTIGYSCYEEPVRKILNHQLAIDGPALPAKDPRLFVKRICSHCVQDLEIAKTERVTSFFDRGIPDAIAYARRFGIDTQEFEELAASERYEDEVFMLPPWEEIFVNDQARGGTFESYLKFDELIRQSYEICGYRITEVPKATLKARAKFIQESINQYK